MTKARRHLCHNWDPAVLLRRSPPPLRRLLRWMTAKIQTWCLWARQNTSRIHWAKTTRTQFSLTRIFRISSDQEPVRYQVPTPWVSSPTEQTEPAPLKDIPGQVESLPDHRARRVMVIAWSRLAPAEPCHPYPNCWRLCLPLNVLRWPGLRSSLRRFLSLKGPTWGICKMSSRYCFWYFTTFQQLITFFKLLK